MNLVMLFLLLQMKNNPIHDKSPVHGDDFIFLPEPRTVVSICSKDTMNVTVSKCCLNVFQNLAKVQNSFSLCLTDAVISLLIDFVLNR